MAEEKILTGDDVLGRETPEYKELLGVMAEIDRVADKVIGEVKPSLLNDRYFSGKEVMAHFHISRGVGEELLQTEIIRFGIKRMVSNRERKLNCVRGTKV